MGNQELKQVAVVNKSFNKSWQALAEPSSIPAIFESKNMQLHFIQIYTLLFTKLGGDEAAMKHWFNSVNKALNATPCSLCQNEAGVLDVKGYFESELIK